MPVKHCLSCRWATTHKEYEYDETLTVTCHALDGVNVPSHCQSHLIWCRPANYWEDGTPGQVEVEVQDGDYPYPITNCPAWQPKEGE